MNYPLHLLKLIESLKKLPGVGSKSAERFAFEMLKWEKADLSRLAALVHEIPEELKTCASCGALQGQEACSFCTEDRNEPQKLCIVGSCREVYAIEATREFKGYYHVLGGLISPLQGIGPESLAFQPLMDRIKNLNIQEVVIALDSTIEGDATALYLKKILNDLDISITRLAFGIPMGSSIDYVDGGTLARAFSGRSRI